MLPAAPWRHPRDDDHSLQGAARTRGANASALRTMDDDDIEEAKQIGVRNREVIRLAATWCKHIRVDRRHMGIGMIEEMTGLPISGGTFTCEHRKGASPSGMQLEPIALDYYERNCVGCSHRAPTGMLPNLGTWADDIIDKRKRQETEVAAKHARDDEAREARRSARRLAMGTPSAVTQSVLDLVDRLDAREHDPHAGEELAALAKLHPESLEPELVEHLLVEAEALQSADLLRALYLVHHGIGRPVATKLVAVALAAFVRRWEVRDSSAFIREHASDVDLDSPNLIKASILAAAPLAPRIGHHAPAEYPGVFLRLLDERRDATLSALSQELRAAHPADRATAAGAAYLVLEERPELRAQLVEPILDALPERDRESRYEMAARATPTDVVAELIRIDPGLVDGVVNQRWATASELQRQMMLKGYDQAVRQRLREEALPEEVCTSVARRALTCMLDPAADGSLLDRAVDLVELVFGYFGRQITLETEWLLGAFALQCQAFDEVLVDESPILKPGGRARKPGLLGELERQNRVSRAHRALDTLTDAVGVVALRKAEPFWATFRQLWDSPLNGDAAALKVQLVRLAGRLVLDYAGLPEALPYLFTGLVGPSQVVRATALRAISKLFEERGDEVALPETLLESILATLDDKFLIVIAASVETVGHLPVPSRLLPGVLQRLLLVAFAYAEDRQRHGMVHAAIKSAMSLSRGRQAQPRVRERVLNIVNKMHGYEAIKTLRFFSELKSEPAWPSVVARALRVDKEYEHLGDDDRSSLLESVSRHAAAVPADAIEYLEKSAVDRISEDHWWAWEVADVLSWFGAHERAVAIADRVVRGIAATAEYKPLRLYAECAAECFRVELLSTTGDEPGVDAALQRWRAATQQLEDDENANRNARKPFFPPYIP